MLIMQNPSVTVISNAAGVGAIILLDESTYAKLLKLSASGQMSSGVMLQNLIEERAETYAGHNPIAEVTSRLGNEGSCKSQELLLNKFRTRSLSSTEVIEAYKNRSLSVDEFKRVLLELYSYAAANWTELGRMLQAKSEDGTMDKWFCFIDHMRRKGVIEKKYNRDGRGLRLNIKEASTEAGAAMRKRCQPYWEKLREEYNSGMVLPNAVAKQIIEEYSVFRNWAKLGRHWGAGTEADAKKFHQWIIRLKANGVLPDEFAIKPRTINEHDKALAGCQKHNLRNKES